MLACNISNFGYPFIQKYLLKNAFSNTGLPWAFLVYPLLYQVLSCHPLYLIENQEGGIGFPIPSLMVIQVVKFPRERYKIRQILDLKSMMIKENFCILWIDIVTSCEKWPKSLMSKDLFMSSCTLFWDIMLGWYYNILLWKFIIIYFF